MPDVAALIYANNDKTGSYTGFFKNIPENYHYDHKDFLAAHALPGPDSIINCIFFPTGLDGGSQQFKLRKEREVSQIPGLYYTYEHIGSLPRPEEWHHQIIDDAMLRSIKLEPVGAIIVTESSDPQMQHKAGPKNPTWSHFTKYCKENAIMKLKQVKEGPDWLQKMFEDALWKKKIVKHL